MTGKGAAKEAAAAADEDEESGSEDEEEHDNRDSDDENNDTKSTKKSKSKASIDPNGSVPAEGERITVQVDGILSDKTFESLGLSKNTMAGIAELGYSVMTEVQARTIPP